MDHLGYIILFGTLLFVFLKKGFDREVNDFLNRNTNEIEKLEIHELWKHLMSNHGRYEKNEFENAANRTNEIVEKANTELIKNIKELTKQILWASGGALLLAANILTSDNYFNFFGKMWFGISLVFFALALVTGLLTFLFRARSLSILLDANRESEKISTLFSELAWRVKKNDNQLTPAVKVEFENKFKGVWDEFRRLTKIGRREDVVSGINIELAISFLVAGILFFVFFGLHNL